MSEIKETVSVVTGANSGLGLGICRRLTDQFLTDHITSPSHRLKIVITTRSVAKAESAISALRQHLSKSIAKHASKNKTLSQTPAEVEKRFSFEYVLLDLCSLYSVTSASRDFLSRFKHVDHFFCNAGLSGVAGIDWLMAARLLPFKYVSEMDYGSFRIQSVGEMTKGHDKISSSAVLHPEGNITEKSGAEEDSEKVALKELGAIFCANVFGHYYLLHEIMPLLHSPSPSKRSRIIWIGSLTSTTNNPFDINDIQAVKSKLCYDSSKRLTEILVKSSDVVPEADSFNAVEPHYKGNNEKEEKGEDVPPVHLIAHPGVISTTFVDLHPIMAYLWVVAAYLARFLGSRWQNIYPYNGAAAPVHVAMVEDLDSVKGKKWGSQCDRLGRVTVVESEIAEGWEDIAGRCWGEMEELRREWKVRIENS